MGGETIGVGLVGCGVIGQFHAWAMGQIASELDIRPVAAADPDKAALEAATSNWGFARTGGDPAGVLQDPEVDAVFVCTPTDTHRDLVLGALDAGKHLYCEKPVAPAFDIVRELADAVGSTNIVAQVGFETRRSAPPARVKTLIDAGDLGPVLGYVVREDECFPTTERTPYVSDWRSKRAHAGGGPLIEHSIHSVDLLCWMFGPPVRAQAATRRVLGYEVEDTAALTLEHASGVVGTLFTIFGGIAGRQESRLEVFGERGCVEITWGGVVLDAPQNTVKVHMANSDPEVLDPQEVLDEHLADLGVASRPFFSLDLSDRAFFDAIRRGVPASPGFDDALVAHATVEAAYRSAASHTSIELASLLG